MIHFVTTQSNAYTIKSLMAWLGRKHSRRWEYESLFRQKAIPTGTWIFTDHERLSPFELAMAGRIAWLLEEAGARVLNHPARVLGRYQLLTALVKAGINHFSAYRGDDLPCPGSFPVFIRNVFDHDAGRFRLIDTQETLDAELQNAKRRGSPLSGKLVIEYIGEEIVPGTWQRLATYRAGGRIIAHHCAYETSWVVKNGLSADQLDHHPSRDALLAAEQEFVTKNLHADILTKAFNIAGIEYGRADFAIVAGRPAIFEINTNPNHAPHRELFSKIHPAREEIQRHSEHALREAILGLDTDEGQRIELTGRALQLQQSLWSPWTRTLQRP